MIAILEFLILSFSLVKDDEVVVYHFIAKKIVAL